MDQPLLFPREQVTSLLRPRGALWFYSMLCQTIRGALDDERDDERAWTLLRQHAPSCLICDSILRIYFLRHAPRAFEAYRREGDDSTTQYNVARKAWLETLRG